VIEIGGRAWCEACKATPAFAEALRTGGPRPPAAPSNAPKVLLGLGIGCFGICLATSLWIAVKVRSTVDQFNEALAPLEQSSCGSELERIGRAARLHRVRKGALPSRAPGESAADVVRRLEREGLLEPELHVRLDEDEEDPLFHCPGTSFTIDDRAREDASYEGFGGGATLAHEGPVAPLLWDRSAANHLGKGRNVLFENGAVRFIPEGATVTALDEHGRLDTPLWEDHALEERLERRRREVAEEQRKWDEDMAKEDEEAEGEEGPGEGPPSPEVIFEPMPGTFGVGGGPRGTTRPAAPLEDAFGVGGRPRGSFRTPTAAPIFEAPTVETPTVETPTASPPEGE
jgi:hypothetical protein